VIGRVGVQVAAVSGAVHLPVLGLGAERTVDADADVTDGVTEPLEVEAVAARVGAQAGRDGGAVGARHVRQVKCGVM
jgi:hypothetical protein